LPPCLDNYITEDNPVRVVDVFVDNLNLADLGFKRVIAEATGWPGYHLATLATAPFSPAFHADLRIMAQSG
jgi:transposase